MIQFNRCEVIIEKNSENSNNLDLLTFRRNLEWRTKFIELGGFQFILNLFLNQDTS